PGDQLREKSHEQTVFQEIVFVGLFSVGVNQIGDLLKGEKRDRQRQDNSFYIELSASDDIDLVDKKVCVFEIAE
ncbi:MAG: hypothetical protein AB2699_07920, partial [Candidatus Thiodiazotropha taylori]